jgi:hypothetical protein
MAGSKTSVYLAADVKAALDRDSRPLAEVIRAGLDAEPLAVASKLVVAWVAREQQMDDGTDTGAAASAAVRQCMQELASAMIHRYPPKLPTAQPGAMFELGES